jgi:hypothetical protein
MCTAIALSTCELPLPLVRQHALASRLHRREGRDEFQFHWWQLPTLLPVRRDGKLEVLPWGCKSRRGPLPAGGWIAVDDLAEGVVRHATTDEVVIPANLGFDKGTWYLISEGIRGIVIDSRGGPVVYMLTEPASNYYRNMTEQSPAMPVFINQVI